MNSDKAVETMAEYLLHRDWPSEAPRFTAHLRYTYRRRAAAILAGEAWAIRETWPEAAHEIATRSDWTRA
jgi:hypothetical protein